MNRVDRHVEPRVFAVGRHDADVAPGGGEIQLTSTVAALRRLGVAAESRRPDEEELRTAECLHLFGTRPEHVAMAEAARRRGVPTVLSTIAWYDLAGYWRGGRTPWGRVAAAGRFLARAACPALPSWRRRLYHAVDLLLPNSTAEARQLIRHFGISPERIRVVPNGADPRFAQGDGRRFVDRFGVRDFVLCPGRIEPRKNQLGLIRAMRRTGVPIVILGQVVPGHEVYLEVCRREADASVRFIDRIDHDDPMLGDAYAACRTLALVGWFETPGLVALEAAMSGTPLVLPAVGCADEYFGPHAEYVRPGDHAGIRRAVLRAIGRPRDPALAQHVRDNFSWDAVADATREAYESVVSRKTGQSPDAGWLGHSAAVPQGVTSNADAPNARLQRRYLGRYRYVRLRWRIMFTAIDATGSTLFRAGRAVLALCKTSGNRKCATACEGVKSVEREAAALLAESLDRAADGKQCEAHSPRGVSRGKQWHTAAAQGDRRVEPQPMGNAEEHVHASVDMAPGQKTIEPSDARSIFIIQLDHLGDAILTTGMIAALRRRYPKASIEVLTGEWNRELFDAIADVDRLHVSRLNRFSRTGRFGWPAAVFWWGWRLRRHRIDLGIDVRGEFPLALMLWLAGIRRRVGWAAGGGGFLLTDSAPFAANRPEVESRAALLAELDIRPTQPKELWPVFEPTEQARDSITRKLAQHGPRRPFAVVHVSAGTPAKQWPPAHWRTLIGSLAVDQGLEVVLVGSKADRIIAQSILEGTHWPGVHDWTGRGDVVELAAMIERAELFIGADSGPAHLAAAVGRPVVVLFSGTNRHEQWQPRGPSVTVLRHPVACSPCHRERCPLAGHPCMNDLRPETVATAVADILDRTREDQQKGTGSITTEDVAPSQAACGNGACPLMRTTAQSNLSQQSEPIAKRRHP